MSTISIDADALPAGLGGIRPLDLPATKYQQGGREMYNVVLTLGQVPQLIAKRPDPNVPIEGNRKVDPARARSFGKYVIEKDAWVAPAIIVRAPSGDVTFKAVKDFEDGTAWGVLSIPIRLLTEIVILDGQHRTLGIFIALDDLNKKIADARESELAAHRNGDLGLAATYRGQLEDLKARRAKIASEHISIDLAIVNAEVSRQMFVDINNNAKGVNPDYTSYLDRRDIVNQVSIDLMEKNALLLGRVETGQANRMSPANPNLLGAKGVADIVRAVHVGTAGRIGSRVEDEMRRDKRGATHRVERFFDIMVDAFPDLQAVRDGALSPIKLRESSMLGSLTMWRVLASVYRELVQSAPDGEEAFTRTEIEEFFSSLDTRMKEIPIAETDEFWMPTGAFLVGTRAPQARQGTLIQLTAKLTEKARSGRKSVPDND